MTFDVEFQIDDKTFTLNETSAAAAEAAAERAEAAAERAAAGVPTNVRQAIYTLLNKAVYTETGLTDEIATVESWAGVITAITLNESAISLSGSATYQLIATTTPAGGTILWDSSDNTVVTVSDNGLVTSVGNGSAVITASCGDLSATCEVAVSGHAVITGITATYTQTKTLYYDSSISDVIPDLVVVANYSDSSTVTIPSDQYAVTGTFTEGISTFTVSYREFSTTFTASVTAVLHPLAQGTHTFSNDSYITVRGNHVKVYASETYDGKTGYQFNFLDINDNTSNALTSTDNANNKSSKFTIPANTPCILSINNVIANGVYTHNRTGTGGQSLVFGNRKALSTSNAGADTIFGSNTTYSETAEGYPTGDYTRTFTLESATDIGSMYVYFGHADAGGTMEFDIVLTIGGTRAI